MRILLDESVPGRLGTLLTGHSTITVQGRGWTSIKNGKLLALAADEFDVLLTADKGMEYQQNLATLPISILVVLARSNRIEDLAAAVTALGLSIREHIRRKYPPRAGLLLRSAAAARRKAWAARLATRLVLALMTLPPVILVPGCPRSRTPPMPA